MSNIKYYNDMVKIAVAMVQKETFESLLKGDSFDKILRNISTRAKDGKLMWNNNGAMKYFPRSKKAREIVVNNNGSWAMMIKSSTTSPRKYDSKKRLHLEHNLPISLVKKRISEILKSQMNEIAKVSAIRQTIINGCKVTLITKEERELIDTKHQSTMPKNGMNRFCRHNILILRQRK